MRIARAREEMEPKPWSQFDLALEARLSDEGGQDG
jgi:hypothetical protein